MLDFLASLLPRPSSKVQLIAEALCSDLFSLKYPKAGRRRRARASAFHHVLTLASDRRLALHQPRHVPFAEIEVRRGAAFSVDMPEVMGAAASIAEGDEAPSDEASIAEGDEAPSDEEDEDDVADEDDEEDEEAAGASEEDDDDGQEGDQKEGQGASDGDDGNDGDAEMEGDDAEMEDDDA